MNNKVSDIYRVQSYTKKGGYRNYRTLKKPTACKKKQSMDRKRQHKQQLLPLQTKCTRTTGSAKKTFSKI